MAELGNMLFDQASGGVELPDALRDEVFAALKRVFDAVDPSRDASWRDYGPEFENGTFQIWPYSWCDCDCGFEARESKWSAENEHHADCYQTKLHDMMANYDQESGYAAIKASAFKGDDNSLFGGMIRHEESIEIEGVAVGMSMIMTPRKDTEMEAYRTADDARDAFEEQVYKELCAERGLEYPRGCAVHCTCDYKDRWLTWIKSNGHDPRCAVARKSFVFKPTGFWLDWYKYPLRDARTNVPIISGKFSKIVDACVESLTSDKGAKITRLADCH